MKAKPHRKTRLSVIGLVTILTVSAWGEGQRPAVAQTSPPPARTEGSSETLPPGTIVPATPSGTQGAVEFGAAPVSTQKTPRKPGGSDLIIAPVPFYNPTIGAGLGLGVGYIFHPNRNDKISPPSALMLGGLGSENGTRGYFGGGKLYLKEDRYRVMAGLAWIDARYDFYGIGNAAADLDIQVPLAQKVTGFMVEGLFRVAPNLFAGLQYLGGKSETSIRDNASSTIAQALAGKELDSNISAFTAKLQEDRRNSTFFPTKGDQLNVTAGFHDPAWGDDFSFQSYQVKYAGYQSLGGSKVLAYTGIANAISGDAPFYVLPSVGMQDGLRGYISGKYRDKTLLSLQAEYRQMFPNRFGFTVFTGASTVAPDFGSFSFDDILGAIGVGARYQLSKQNPVNYRIDYAYGKDGGTVYFAVGEAF